MGINLKGQNYQNRVQGINRIYDEHVRSGMTNREIWRRYVYPEYAVSERAFYNALKATVDAKTMGNKNNESECYSP